MVQFVWGFCSNIAASSLAMPRGFLCDGFCLLFSQALLNGSPGLSPLGIPGGHPQMCQDSDRPHDRSHPFELTPSSGFRIVQIECNSAHQISVQLRCFLPSDDPEPEWESCSLVKAQHMPMPKFIAYHLAMVLFSPSSELFVTQSCLLSQKVYAQL